MLSGDGGRKDSPVRMPLATEAETTLLEAVRALPSGSQRAVVSDALFLGQQEGARRLEADEATWDLHFGQPDKLARFAEWARPSQAEHPGRAAGCRQRLSRWQPHHAAVVKTTACSNQCPFDRAKSCFR